MYANIEPCRFYKLQIWIVCIPFFFFAGVSICLCMSNDVTVDMSTWSLAEIPRKNDNNESTIIRIKKYKKIYLLTFPPVLPQTTLTQTATNKTKQKRNKTATTICLAWYKSNKQTNKRTHTHKKKNGVYFVTVATTPQQHNYNSNATPQKLCVTKPDTKLPLKVDFPMSAVED